MGTTFLYFAIIFVLCQCSEAVIKGTHSWTIVACILKTRDNVTSVKIVCADETVSKSFRFYLLLPINSYPKTDFTNIQILLTESLFYTQV